MSTVPLGLPSWERCMTAVEAVHDRLKRATTALNTAGVDYAVIGGNAVAAWVGRVDPSAVRFTQDVDLLVRRADLDAVKTALQPAGFIYRHVASIDMFLDGPDARARDALHLVFSGEQVRPEYILPAPEVSETEVADSFRVLSLDSLIRMKLTSFRRKDQVHLLDMIGVGLIDANTPGRFPPELARRLQELLDNPEG